MAKKLKLTRALIFNERTKWKYNMELIMLKDEMDYTHPDPFLVYIEDAMKFIPSTIRGVTFEQIPEGWRVIVPSSPLGYPIMAVGTAHVR